MSHTIYNPVQSLIQLHKWKSSYSTLHFKVLIREAPNFGYQWQFTFSPCKMHEYRQTDGQTDQEQDRQTDRKTDWQTDNDKSRQTVWHWQTKANLIREQNPWIETNRQTNRKSDLQTDRYTDHQIVRQTMINLDRNVRHWQSKANLIKKSKIHEFRQTDRHTDRETDRQGGRQTYR